MPKADFVAVLKGTRPPRIVELQAKPGEEALIKSFLADKAHREKEKGKQFDLEVRLSYDVRKRTLKQNALYWSLVSILSWECYRQHEWEEVIHEELLTLYAPRVDGKLTGKQVAKRSRHMDTREFAELIEGAFAELASHGVGVDSAAKIRGYWIEWQMWRGAQGVDPLSQTYKDLADYCARVPFCIACLKYIGPDVTILPHIVSKGAGGTDAVWNRLRLCDDCHIEVQHRKGWDGLIEKYPHVRHHVEAARMHAGYKPLPEKAPVKELTDV